MTWAEWGAALGGWMAAAAPLAVGLRLIWRRACRHIRRQEVSQRLALRTHREMKEVRQAVADNSAKISNGLAADVRMLQAQQQTACSDIREIRATLVAHLGEGR